MTGHPKNTESSSLGKFGLLSVCTVTDSVTGRSTNSVEQVFAMEEDEDPEDMGAMMEQSQWTGRGMTEPQMSPSLQHMFALARRMGYDMRPITRCSGTAQGCRDIITGRRLDRDGTTRRSSASAVVRWDTRRPGAPNRIFHFPSGRMGGIHNPTVSDSALMDHNRETTYRPGTHPYQSARDSFGPQIIFIVHINKFFGIVSLTHRWSPMPPEILSIRSGCNSIDRRLLRSYY